MDEIMQAIANYGVGIVCIGYIIFMQNTTMKEMNATLNKMNNSLELVTDRLENIESKINKTPKKKKEEDK